jgi:hypothetical protein
VDRHLYVDPHMDMHGTPGISSTAGWGMRR